MADAKEDLLSWGFVFDTARDRCGKGMTDEAYQCMLERASAECRGDVRARIELRDFVVHLRAQRGLMSSMGARESELWEKITTLTTRLRKKGYDWKDSKTTCRKHLKEEAERIRKRTLSELSVGEEIDGICQEAAGKMCPEGTYATTKRRWNKLAGAAITGTIALISKFTLVPLGTAAGAAAGPAGATAGFMIGSSLGWLIASAVGFWTARGPLECACFPRDCTFDLATGACQLGSHNATSSNPWAVALPMAGMKCTLAYKSNETCALQPCAAEDYVAPRAAPGGAPKSRGVFGTMGQQGKALYNCLSATPSQSGMLATSTVLPDGEPNTVEGRNEIYGELLGA